MVTNHHLVQTKKVQKASDKSIIIIGMRGTGKSTLSEWLASFMGFKSLDMDVYLEEKLGNDIKSLIKEKAGSISVNKKLPLLKNVSLNFLKVMFFQLVEVSLKVQKTDKD